VAETDKTAKLECVFPVKCANTLITIYILARNLEEAPWEKTALVGNEE